MIRLVVAALAAAAALSAGDLNRRFDLALERALHGGPPHYTAEFLAADLIPRDVRRFTNFSGDLSGRYLGALAEASRYRPGAAEQLPTMLSEFLKHQRTAGRFGDPLSASGAVDDDMARLWGSGRMLIGLIELYRETGSTQALDSARRLGDFLVDVGPRFNDAGVQDEFYAGKMAHGYICWTQNIEGLVGLHAATNDQRYLALAGEMADRIERRPGQHSHGWLTSLRGALDLFEATGDAERLAAVERAWEDFVASKNLLVDAGVPEYFAPGIHRDEGCSQADWLRLNLRLWSLTRNRRYLDAAERTWFNAFSRNQFPTGDFGHVIFSQEGYDFGGARAWWCCTLHGLRAFPAVLDSVFHADGETLYYDLPVDGTATLNGLAFDVESKLETDASVEFTVRSPGAGKLAVRVPPWSDDVGLPFESELVDGYRLIFRSWQEGETFTVRYRPRTVTLDDERQPGATVVFHGPWLLGVSEYESSAYFDEPHEHNKPDLDQLGPGDRASRLSLAYLPAGYAESPERAILRPLAERTWSETGLRWAFRFGTQSSDRSLAEKVRRWREPATWAGGGFLAGLIVGLLLLRRRARR